MNRIRTLIVDDEPLARENLRIRLQGFPELELVGECATGREAVETIGRERPDLLFLDIQMPDWDGFQVLEQIPEESMPVVVFVTAYDRYALQAFRTHALDYILKPFDEDRLKECVEACIKRLQVTKSSEPGGARVYGMESGRDVQSNTQGLINERVLDPAGPDGAPSLQTRLPYLSGRLVIKHKGRILLLKVEEVDWIGAEGDYTCLHTAGGSYLVRRTMNEMESRLDPSRFARVNRSAMVNLDRIQDLAPAQRGEFLIRLTSGREIKLTRSYRIKLESLLGDRFC